jgi:small subunit ribosomal protein S4e
MSDHRKRLAAPRSWPLKRKVNVFVAKQTAGAHSIEESMPAVTVLRDMIGACDTAKEAKRIIGNREMIVDGKAVKSPKAPVGFMDIVQVPKMNLTYRMLLTDKGKLTLVPVDEAEAAWEICKIENKTIVKGGKFQLNLSGGRNIVLDKNDYKCGDSLKVAFDGQAIQGHYPMQAGACVLIRFGSQAGAVRSVKAIETVRGPAENRILFTDGTETVASNCIVIGADKPEIKLPEASE